MGISEFPDSQSREEARTGFYDSPIPIPDSRLYFFWRANSSSSFCS